MRRAYIGDSFDLVKRCLLRGLAETGPWQAHPMFTEELLAEEADRFSRLLGVPLVSREVLGPRTNRNKYFEPACDCDTHVFLDPDTGLRLHSIGGRKAISYLFADELIRIMRARSGRLALVFDQSLEYGSAREALTVKLAALGRAGLYGTAYVSHACFIIVARESELLSHAVGALQRTTGLPPNRFLEVAAAGQPRCS